MKEQNIKLVQKVSKLSKGTLPIIACGGVQNATDVVDYLRAGATMVQLYTSLIYEGPGLVREIKDDLGQMLKGRSWEEFLADNQNM